MTYKIVGIGCSLGGMRALERILAPLPHDLPLPVVIVQHRSAESDNESLERYFSGRTALRVSSIDDKDPIEPGIVYFAPADYHVLVEEDTFALSVDDRIQFSRPSIDVLFSSMADAYGARCIGVILTGANNDGAEGLMEIGRAGGYTIVQDPEEAVAPSMPRAALRLSQPDTVASLDEIAPLLTKLAGEA